MRKGILQGKQFHIPYVLQPAKRHLLMLLLGQQLVPHLKIRPIQVESADFFFSEYDFAFCHFTCRHIKNNIFFPARRNSVRNRIGTKNLSFAPHGGIVEGALVVEIAMQSSSTAMRV